MSGSLEVGPLHGGGRKIEAAQRCRTRVHRTERSRPFLGTHANEEISVKLAHARGKALKVVSLRRRANCHLGRALRYHVQLKTLSERINDAETHRCRHWASDETVTVIYATNYKVEEFSTGNGHTNTDVLSAALHRVMSAISNV